MRSEELGIKRANQNGAAKIAMPNSSLSCYLLYETAPYGVGNNYF